jgi:hypothetical protein
MKSLLKRCNWRELNLADKQRVPTFACRRRHFKYLPPTTAAAAAADWLDAVEFATWVQSHWDDE